MPQYKLLFLTVFAFTCFHLHSQNESSSAMNSSKLPYYEIPASPDSFTAENVVARMVDGLGFRYYWATEGLRPEDLAFRPSEGARTSEETIDHILGLSTIILNGVKNQPNVRSGEETSALAFEVKRKKTLENLKEASDILKTSGAGLENYGIVFMNGDSKTEFPFWNMINGPIADALWHVGQVITFRRSSGNPFNSKASVLTGKVRQ
ncbi:MAG: hypothetical protein SF052_27335 [Bacteroidia bacterium]|nr:hypothetical protein [Bacteroidia bacterium]